MSLERCVKFFTESYLSRTKRKLNPRENFPIYGNSMWNFDPGSQFNVEFGPGVTIQRGILTRLHIFYPLNCDSRRCQNQQHDPKSTTKEGRNSTKNPLNIDPGRFSMEGSKFYLTPGFDATIISCFQIAIWLKYDVNPQYNQPTKYANVLVWLISLKNNGPRPLAAPHYL